VRRSPALLPAARIIPALLLLVALAPAPAAVAPERALVEPRDLGCLETPVAAWGLQAIQAPEAQAITPGSPKVVVAVVDSGIDITHPDLADHLWRNPGEIPDNGIDDDGNGFIDDVFGFNFVPPRNNNVNDTLGHGTFVASIVASVAPGVRIMAVRAGADGTFNLSNKTAAIRYAVDNGASVINYSAGGSLPNQPSLDVLNYAVAHDVVVVLAGGNDASTSSSAAFYPGTMAVAATTRRDQLAPFSNYGDWVDVAAPGTEIYGAFPGAQHGVCQGTSMSAPYVAGAAALLRSAEPGLSAAQVIQRIDEFADDINAANPRFQGRLTFGRLNVYRALTQRPPAPPSAPAAPAQTPPVVSAPPAAPPAQASTPGPVAGGANAGALGSSAAGSALGALSALGGR
jgi:subtilisin family serine protease